MRRAVVCRTGIEPAFALFAQCLATVENNPLPYTFQSVGTSQAPAMPFGASGTTRLRRATQFYPLQYLLCYRQVVLLLHSSDVVSRNDAIGDKTTALVRGERISMPENLRLPFKSSSECLKYKYLDFYLNIILNYIEITQRIFGKKKRILGICARKNGKISL